MANYTLFDLAILDRADEYTGLIDDVTYVAPEFSTFSAHKRPGTWYKVVKQTSLPQVYFRSANQGISASKSTFKSEIKQMFFLDCRLQLDEMIMEADPREIGGLWQETAKAAIRSASIAIGQQVYYGTGASVNGFPGVRSQLSYTYSVGTGPNTTSAYLLNVDPQIGCRFDVGQNGEFAISQPLRQQVNDAQGNSYFAYVGNLHSWIGFNVMSNMSCFAVTGISSTSSANYLTDKAVAQLTAGIPIPRRKPIICFINRLAEMTLQLSRSTINIGISASPLASYQPASSAGTPAFSPAPDRVNGFPIVLTDSILNTETN
jgi:hypothetical protein